MRKVITVSLIVIAAVVYLSQSGIYDPHEKGIAVEQVNGSEQKVDSLDVHSSELNSEDYLQQTDERNDSDATLNSTSQELAAEKRRAISVESEIQIPRCIEKELTDDELEQVSQDWENVMQRVDELNEKAHELELADSELELARILALNMDEEHKKIESLSDYLNKYPQSEIASLVFLMECSSNPKHSICNDLIEAELASDSQYSFSHMLNLIALVIQAGDRDVEVQRLMNESTSVPNFEEYYSAIIELMFRYYTILGAPQNKMDRINISVSVAGVNFINFYPIMQYCKEHAAERQLLADSCISIGKRLESFGETMIAQIFGVVFQIETYKLLGNEELAEAANVRKDAMSDYRNSEEFLRSSGLINYDEQVLDAWFNSLLNGTEKSAFDSAIDKAKELASDPNYNPCSTKLGTF
ncbi:MAG: hypothetical protein OQJ89_09935 [Kangiellaceae bacterium]|nr:hypothetical protein [Kangiellaceae bacterium]MCW9000379.1 hypothetical protein [Kangiellaceae bacterium]MCW9017275.1 hypothetical protein [Kangiellaceae bacterium]